MRSVGIAIAAVLLLSIVSACSGDDAEESTTTTLLAVTTQATDASGGGTTASSATTSTTTSAAPGEEGSTATFPRYQIVARETGDDGDVVVVLLDPESYDGLTDIDLQNVIADVVEEFPPVLEAHVLDSAEAAAIVLTDDPDEEAQALLDAHYFARLEEGFRIVYTGPFKSRGESILGS